MYMTFVKHSENNFFRYYVSSAVCVYVCGFVGMWVCGCVAHSIVATLLNRSQKNDFKKRQLKIYLFEISLQNNFLIVGSSVFVLLSFVDKYFSYRQFQTMVNTKCHQETLFHTTTSCCKL